VPQSAFSGARENFAGQAQARLEPGEITKPFCRFRRVPDYRVTLLGKRRIDHQIVGVAEVFDDHAFAVPPYLVGGVVKGRAASLQPVDPILCVIRVAEDRFSETPEKAELEYRAGVGAGPAERSKIGDPKIRISDHRQIGAIDQPVYAGLLLAG